MVESYKIVLVAVLLLLSSFFSGLNLGYLEMDPKYLELLTMGPFESEWDEKLAKQAKIILPLRRRGNLLVSTILLGNLTVNAALAILLAEFAGGFIGLVVSTFLIVIIGEIIP